MTQTILLLILIAVVILTLIYLSIWGSRLSRKTITISALVALAVILILVVSTGTEKIKSDLSRILRNSAPKNSKGVYELLFRKPINDCVSIINFKDQVIPKMDCCIWMELNICPEELNRILSLKTYTRIKISNDDSLNFTSSFDDKPGWWKPQLLGDSLTRFQISFDTDNEQTLIIGNDSAHVFLCDQAL